MPDIFELKQRVHGQSFKSTFGLPHKKYQGKQACQYQRHGR
jgi:hypothetical protein